MYSLAHREILGKSLNMSEVLILHLLNELKYVDPSITQKKSSLVMEEIALEKSACCTGSIARFFTK